MAEKFGSSFAREMIDRGRRELAGVMYGESNVAQPMYPNRGFSRDSPDPTESRSLVQERLDQIGPEEPGREGPERDGPEMDR